MAKDKLQASRFELKYFINDDVALQIRDFVSCHLELDENGVGKPNYSYPVHSLYLDSDDLKLYWATINGDKNRFKLRIRFYSNDPAAPVFFEVKRRMNNCIMKQRGGVRRKAVEAILAGQMPDADVLMSKDPKHEFALMRFWELMQEIQAKPKAHVGYVREAWVPHDDNSARLTMDREVRIEPELEPRLDPQMDPRKAAFVWGNRVVLELKFTNRFPDWFGHLVRTFNLRQCGAAKYVDGVATLGEFRLDTRRAKRAAILGDGDENEIFLPNPERGVLIHEESR